MRRKKQLDIDGNRLTLEDFEEVVFNGTPVVLSAGARRNMLASRRVVERIAASDTPAYGINTGFGKLADRHIGHSQIKTLQVNLIRSHACGVGPPLSEAETRGMMLCRANALAKGFSGVRPEVVTFPARPPQQEHSSHHPLSRFRRSERRSRPPGSSCPGADRRGEGLESEQTYIRENGSPQSRTESLPSRC